MKRIESGGQTKSIWTEPGSNFFRFLKRAEETGFPQTLAILGCSDGTYVLPAARRGFQVLALDIDPVALYGGVITVGENKTEVMGLVERLRREGLADRVTVVNEDYVTYAPESPYSGVFTSGSVHYQENSRHSLANILRSIQSYVTPRGVLDMEYIHVSESNNNPDRYYLTRAEVAQFFLRNEWVVTSNKRKTYIEAPNPRNPQTHCITWGRLYAQRKQLTMLDK